MTDTTEADVLAAAGRAFTLWGQDNAHPDGISASTLVNCTKRAALMLSCADESDPRSTEENRAAATGAILHSAILPYMAHAFHELDQARGLQPSTVLVEHATAVTHGPVVIPGRPDLFHHQDLLEFKTGRRWASHRRQAEVYALALAQDGHEVTSTTLLYFDLSSKDFTASTRPFGTHEGLRVLHRIETVHRWSRAPDSAPRDFPGPGLRTPGSRVCEHCPYLRRCWGPDAAERAAGVQRRLARTNRDVERAATAYAILRRRITQDQARKDLLAAVLKGRRGANYGRWYVATGDDKDGDDLDALKEFWLQYHPQLPRKRTGGALTVQPARGDTLGNGEDL